MKNSTQFKLALVLIISTISLILSNHFSENPFINRNQFPFIVSFIMGLILCYRIRDRSETVCFNSLKRINIFYVSLTVLCFLDFYPSWIIIGLWIISIAILAIAGAIYLIEKAEYHRDLDSTRDYSIDLYRYNPSLLNLELKETFNDFILFCIPVAILIFNEFNIFLPSVMTLGIGIGGTLTFLVLYIDHSITSSNFI